MLVMTFTFKSKQNTQYADVSFVPLHSITKSAIASNYIKSLSFIDTGNGKVIAVQ